MNKLLVILPLLFAVAFANECRDDCDASYAKTFNEPEGLINHTICNKHCDSLETPMYVNPGEDACRDACDNTYPETKDSEALSNNPWGKCMERHCNVDV